MTSTWAPPCPSTVGAWSLFLNKYFNTAGFGAAPAFKSGQNSPLQKQLWDTRGDAKDLWESTASPRSAGHTCQALEAAPCKCHINMTAAHITQTMSTKKASNLCTIWATSTNKIITGEKEMVLVGLFHSNTLSTRLALMVQSHHRHIQPGLVNENIAAPNSNE